MNSITSQYQKQRSYPPLKPCGFSSVQAVQSLVIGKTEHSGVITHRCMLIDGHKEPDCACGCGYTWRTWK